MAAGLALAIPAAPARAQATEQILDYAVDLRVEAAGTLLVTERIAYDFGGEERHGIFRDLPVRFGYDDRYDRVYPVHVLEVSGSPGTPDQYKVEDVDSTLRIRIGDPDQTINGRHDYTIVYRVEGTLSGFADHDELYWNAIGTQWEVPIEHASVTVSAPAPISQVACYAGPAGSNLSCASSQADGRTASFATTGLDPNEGLTVVVGFPTGAVPAPRPILDERWSLARAFSATPGTLGMAGGVLLVVLLVLGWLFGMTGRDRRPGDAPAPLAGAVVESAPPEGIRPAQAGLLVDEIVNPVAITATLVDLAVRGYLRIEEDAFREDSEEPDWRLVKLKAADEDLLGYERVLLDGLFASRRRIVQLSDLKEHFYYDQFSPYLPYAIVFGLTEQWTRTFALVGAPPQPSWYGGRGPWSPDRFPSRMDRFASSSAAILAASPPAVSGLSGFGGGGSGFSGGGGGGSSGGGGGGGGGGSW